MYRDTNETCEEDLLPAEFDSEPETVAGKLVQKTPWWSISIGLHTVGALLVGFFWVVGAVKDTEALVVTPPRPPRTVPKMDPIKKLDDNKKILDIEKKSEEVVYKRAIESDHTETPDEEDFKKAKGDSLDMVSDKPFKGKGTFDVIGGGGGGGGRFGGREGGKLDLVASGGGNKATEDAVLDALKWLSRHQSAGGSWKVSGYVSECNKIARLSSGGSCAPNPGHDDFDAGVTGLSLLAFLGAGYSHLSKDTHDGICFGDVVRRGIQWMMAHQDPEGCIGSRNNQKYMYNHTVCALAMSEAYGLTGSRLFKDQAQRSIDFIIAAQNPGRAWRYSYKCGDNDSSVTGWAIMALKSAEISGLAFPRSGYDGTAAWYDEVTGESYGRVGYNALNTGKVFIPGVNEHFDHHEALTAIAIMSRIFMTHSKKDPRITNGAQLILRDLPNWDGNAIDFYYWYYASLALFQQDGPVGRNWKQWNEPMKDVLVNNQNKSSKGCRHGSWEPVGRWCPEGGRVYGTAINALTLEVYYRYANVFVGGSSNRSNRSQ